MPVIPPNLSWTDAAHLDLPPVAKETAHKFVFKGEHGGKKWNHIALFVTDVSEKVAISLRTTVTQLPPASIGYAEVLQMLLFAPNPLQQEVAQKRGRR